MKMIVQNVILPIIYIRYKKDNIQEDLVLFATAHDKEIPFSMQCAYAEAEKTGCEIKLFLDDYGEMSFMETFRSMAGFMKYYARAKYVFICDYFLPVSSCRKRPETTVVQLWHSGGVMKKMGYDTTEDIPSYYRGDMFGNYSLVSVSSAACARVIGHAMRLPEGRVKPLGLSRTDRYFDEAFIAQCREEFYRRHPGAAGKKVVLWAPTFRGNAAEPYLEGADAISRLFERHQDSWYGVIKAHPHLDRNERISNCELPTEMLLAVTDLMITDFSSIMYDYLLFEKPCLLYAPDYDAYVIGRGIYLQEQEIPFQIVKEEQELEPVAEGLLMHYNPGEHDQVRDLYMGNCDGQATKRIFREIGIYK